MKKILNETTFQIIVMLAIVAAFIGGCERAMKAGDYRACLKEPRYFQTHETDCKQYLK